MEHLNWPNVHTGLSWFYLIYQPLDLDQRGLSPTKDFIVSITCLSPISFGLMLLSGDCPLHYGFFVPVDEFGWSIHRTVCGWYTDRRADITASVVQWYTVVVMETRCGNLFFISKFDSGNLARVEKATKDDDSQTGMYFWQSLLLEDALAKLCSV